MMYRHLHPIMHDAAAGLSLAGHQVPISISTQLIDQQCIIEVSRSAFAIRIMAPFQDLLRYRLLLLRPAAWATLWSHLRR